MWNPIQNADDGFLAGLNVIMKTLNRGGDALPDFSKDVGIFVASDYGGQHRFAAYEAYSFVFTTPVQWISWELERRRLRQDLHLSRRMSFKNLSDTQRWNALPRFMSAASSLSGLTITVLVQKKIKSLLTPGRKIDVRRPELARFKGWKVAILERMLRVTYLFAFFVAGLSSKGQRIIWITDEDDIVANADRHQDVVDAAVTALSRFATHSLADVEVATTASDNGTLEIEDLAGIADLVAGSVVEAMTALAEHGGTTSPALFRVADPLTTKSIRLLYWLSESGLPLKHVVIAIDPGSTPSQLNFRRMAFGTMVRPRLVHIP
jgi:hypothetical protein